jgi:hypothetical protein
VATATRTGAQYDELLKAMAAAFPDEDRVAFSRHMADPEYARLYEVGYEEGRRQGLDDAFKRWRGRLTNGLAILRSAIDPELFALLLAGSLENYLLRREGSPVVIRPALRRRLEAALWFKALEPVFAQLDRCSAPAWRGCGSSTRSTASRRPRAVTRGT